jgi:hypothetical protein
VRLGGGNENGHADYLVEIFRIGVDSALQRVQVAGGATEVIPLDGTAESLVFLPTTGLSVHARWTPGMWLLGLALAMMIVGAYGHRNAPAFLILQVGPWPVDRSVVVAQGSVESEIDLIERWCDRVAGTL